MEGIRFGGYHSYDDLEMILTSGVEIGSPTVKNFGIDIPGADGEADYTEYFGRVVYGNRTLKFPFICVCDADKMYDKHSSLCSKLHGRKMRIVPDDDADFYYVGRVAVSDMASESVIGNVTITCNCEPYKYKQDETVMNITVGGTKEITCFNLRRPVCPVFSSSGDLVISFGNVRHTVSSAQQMFTDIIFVEGDNQLSVTGTGKLQIRYQEATI